jgi:hypothetical protein
VGVEVGVETGVMLADGVGVGVPQSLVVEIVSSHPLAKLPESPPAPSIT